MPSSLKSFVAMFRFTKRRSRSKEQQQQGKPCAEAAQAVFDAFGLLETVLEFVPVEDRLSAAAVNRQWKKAARNELLWKQEAQQLWKDKQGMPQDNSQDELFGKTLYSDAAIEQMTSAQMRSLLSRSCLVEELGALDENDTIRMRQLVQQYMRRLAADRQRTPGSCPIVFDDVWFGSYVASLVESRRTVITKQELCSSKGFVLHPKKGIILTHNIPIVYFEKSGLFSWQDMHDEGTYPSQAEIWKWLEHDEEHSTGEHQKVQVGGYVPLRVVRRQADWGWMLENRHVQLVLRGEHDEE